MAPKIFITGVTGYIGGDVLYALNEKHPEYEYSALIRTEQKAEPIKKAYPKLRVVIGGLDDSEIIEKEAARADIVIHTADSSDHVGSAKAIAKGLAAGHSKDNPGFWLHIGGTGILTYFDSSAGKLGEWTDKEFDDWDHVDELTHLPDEAFHRNVDKIVLEAGTKNQESVKTAIVCPPTIYGPGRGPSNTRSRQAYELAKLILTESYIPITGAGKARWNNVNVHDLSSAFVLLVEAALNPSLQNSEELWGPKGYILIENGEHLWADLARLLGKKAEELGYLKGLKEEHLSQKKIDEKGYDFQVVSWGLNSRCKAVRARKVLGWKPTGKTLEEEAENIVKSEKELLG